MNLRKYLSTYISILKLGLPLIVGQLGLIVTAFADTIMVGNYSTDSLASASFVNNLFNTPLMAIMGFTYGLTPLAGALFGQGRKERIGLILKVSMIVTTLFALLVVGIMFGLYCNIRVFDAPEHLLPEIRPYYLLYLVGLIPMAVFGVLLQWSYATTRTVFPTILLLGANLFNIIGNYALIYGHFGFPELGLTGAGISTLIARTLPLIIFAAVIAMRRSDADYRKGFTTGKITGTDVRLVANTSWPVALQLALESGSFTLAAVMAGWLGVVPLASFQVVVVTGMLGFCIYYSIGNAIAILVANDSGKSDTAGMRLDAWAGYHIMLVFMIAASVMFYFAGHSIMSNFTNDPEVLAASLLLIAPLIVYQLGDATQITFSNALRGTSCVMPMLWIAFIAYIVVGIPAMYLLGFTFGLGVYGIILSFSVSLFLAAALFLYYFFHTLRRIKPNGETIVIS